MSYTGEQFSQVENLLANNNDSYVLVNGRAGFRWNAFEFAIFANNLFDERFITRRFLQSVGTSSGVVSINDGNSQFRVNTPRIWGVEVISQF